MNKKQKDNARAIAFSLTCAFFYVYGVYIGIKTERKRKAKAKWIIKSDPTSAVLMTVGMNALVDGIYDNDELRYMIEQADIADIDVKEDRS